MEKATPEKNENSYLYQDIEKWTKEEVKQWASEVVKIDQKYAEILFKEVVTGFTLKLMTKKDLVEMGIPQGPALQIMHFLEVYDILDKGPNQSEQEGTGQSLGGEGKDGAIAKKECNKNNESFNSSILKDSKTEPTEDTKGIESDGKKNVSDESLSSNQHPTGNMCMPYPFDNFSDGTRYIQYNILNVPETGASNLIDPVHEFKSLTNTGNTKEENIMMKFSNEVFRFAAACMNCRTNGTIHFGVQDKPHGKIEGIKVTEQKTYTDHLNRVIRKYFQDPYTNIAKSCIREPRFVEVLLQNGTSTNLFVIEVDVVPQHSICDTNYFSIKTYIFKTERWEKAVFIRDGDSSRNIHGTKEFKEFKDNLTSSADRRKRAEEEHNLKAKKPTDQGLKLGSLLTGNRDSLNKSYYDHYILVTNKCHPSQTSGLDFLHEIKWFAVLDFDSESDTNGVLKTYQKNRNAKLHFPNYYEGLGGSISEQAKKLKLPEKTNWIFCNGGSDFKGNKEPPLDSTSWQQDRAADVRKMISFLSHSDVRQNGKFLVVFLLLSTVEDSADPLTETFMAFYQELKGLEDMVCICIGASTYQRWKDLLHARGISEEALSKKCISNVTLEMVNGTIIKLASHMRSSERLLPCVGVSTVLLPKKTEDSMAALEILCENECKGTGIENDKDKFQNFLKEQEEEFYRGGKVSWWNFYFSSETYTSDFIRRDSYKKLEHLIRSSSNSVNEPPVKIINLYHHPGCGGTTLSMHILWDFRKEFRCAVLKNKPSDIGTQVTTLLTWGASNDTGYLPVLLLVDDFEEQESVYVLQKEIQTAVTGKGLRYGKPVVIILNCMRSQNPDENSTINSLNSVSLKHELSEKEQRAFDQKLKDIKKEHSNPDNFYSFMIMKKNFDPRYIEKVVKNTLLKLDTASKPAQLVCYLALLNSYVQKSTISISLCEKFLGKNSQGLGFSKDKVIEKMGICSNILISDQVQEYMSYKGLRIIHPLIASHCLTELKLTYGLTKSAIIVQLLKEDLFYKTSSEQDKLTRYITTLLLTRQRRERGDESDTFFSPLIEAIHKEEKSGNVEYVLEQASNRFEKNGYICQALARFYIKKRNFDAALNWAKTAKERAQHNSYISDTLGQVFKSQLREWVEYKGNRAALTAEKLEHLLELAENASQAFQESQRQAENAAKEQNLRHLNFKEKFQMYNTAGYQGEIETGLYVIDVLWHVPFFNKEDLQCRKNMAKYLSGNSVLNIENFNTDSEMFKGLEHHSSSLCHLRSRLKRAFDFFEDYFVFFKAQTREREIVEEKLNRKVQECFTKYKEIFCDFSFEQLRSKQASKWPIFQYIEAYRNSLEAVKADSFSGILKYLHGNADREIEDIVDAYAILCQKNEQPTQKDKQNLILSNIVLNCIKPKSAKLRNPKELKGLLLHILPEVKQTSWCVEPFFLASLLFWPPDIKQLNEDSRKMEDFVKRLSESFEKQYATLHHFRQPLALFYLAKGSGLSRFVHKGKIDQLLSSLPEQELNSLWQSEAIWREQPVQDLLLPLNGRVEGNIIYIDYGSNENFRIPVQPVSSRLLENSPNIERVSFYLGFSIAGLLAYNTQSLPLK